MGTVKDLLNKIEKCTTYRDIYKLDKLFESNGMAVATTINGNTILCRLEEGRPCADNLIDDYIFIEGKNDEKIDKNSREVLKYFVSANAGTQRTAPSMPSYQDNYRLYGKPISIKSEPKKIEEQYIDLVSRLIEG